MVRFEMVHRNAAQLQNGMSLDRNSVSLSNRLTQFRMYYTVRRSSLFSRREKKLQNVKTNEWQAASKVGVTGDIFFHPPPAKENWSGNEIAGVTRGLKRVNPSRLLLRHVMHVCTKNGMRGYTCRARTIRAPIHARVENHRDLYKRDPSRCFLLGRVFYSHPSHMQNFMQRYITDSKVWIFRRAHLNKTL